MGEDSKVARKLRTRVRGPTQVTKYPTPVGKWGENGGGNLMPEEGGAAMHGILGVSAPPLRSVGAPERLCLWLRMEVGGWLLGTGV